MIDQIKDAIKGRYVFGIKQACKALKSGTADRILVSKDCKKEAKEKIEYYARIAGVTLINLDIPSEDIAPICKRQHRINVITVLKEEK